MWKYLAFVKTLKCATKVTFISHKSQREAEGIVKFKKNQCVVVYNAVGPDYKYCPKEINTKYPLVLHVATKPNKNLDNTIVALRDFPCKLRIIGKISNLQQSLLDKYHTDYSNVWDLTNEEIVKEYENCDIVNFPSLHEGFGQITIEAQAVGRPVVTSNLSPMKEIAGGAAALVDPTDVDSIRAGYADVIEHWREYVEKGLINVQQNFSVEKITKDFYNVYKSVINSTNG